MRGPRTGTARRTAAGHPPTAHRRTRHLGRRTCGSDHRSGVEPDVSAIPAVAARLAGDRRRGTALRIHSRRPRGRRRGGRGVALRLHRSRRSDAHTGCHRSASAAAAQRVGPRPRRHRRRGGAGRRSIDPRSGAGEQDRRTGAPGDRHGSRAHRHRVAVADPRNGAQVRAYVRLGGGVDGRRTGLRVLLLAGPAIRVDPPA